MIPRISRGRTPNRRGRGRGRGRGRVRGIPSTSRNEMTNREFHDKWTATSFAETYTKIYEPAYLPINDEDWGIQDYFNQYFEDDYLRQIVHCTNRTQVHETGKSLLLDVKELKVYLGITMVMASLQYPQIDMYWSKKWKVPLISSAMARPRFYAIRTNLKVVYDPEITAEMRQTDKLWKVRPILEWIRQGCLKQQRTVKLSIDEMIIPFSGQCPVRQYCPNKPNPLGLKVFVLASPQGIVIDFEVYQGENTFPELRQQGFGLGEAVVLGLTTSLVPGHELFFDRYFTTIKLDEELLARGFNAAGTIMRNRLPKDCVMEDEKTFMKKPRGSSEVKYRDDKKLAVTRWMDNKPVLMLSTFLADGKTSLCERWSKKNKKYENVTLPEVIKDYNSNMGGVDLMDRLLAVCPSRNRTKKWTIRCISHMVDVAIVNSYLQFKQKEKKKGVRKVKKLRDFKLELGMNLIVENDVKTDSSSDDSIEELRPKHKKRKTVIKPIPSERRRRQEAKHLPRHGPTQMRCRKDGCYNKTTVYCQKCEIYLCFTTQRNCYTDFHT